MSHFARTSPGGYPRTRMSPESAKKKPISMLMLVVLPAPLGPRKAQTSPGKTENVAFVSAATSTPRNRLRYTLVTSRNSIAGVVIRVLILARRRIFFQAQGRHQAEFQSIAVAVLDQSDLAVLIDHKEYRDSFHSKCVAHLAVGVPQNRKRQLCFANELRCCFGIFIGADGQDLEAAVLWLVFFVERL